MVLASPNASQTCVLTSDFKACIYNPVVPVLMFHTTLNVLSFCTSPLSSSFMLIFFLQCSCGIDFITLVLLHTNFIKLNPPALEIFYICWIKPAALSSLLKISASCKYKTIVWMFFLHQSQILFHYLLKFISKHNCCNLEMKYHQIDVHTFHDLQLDFWYLHSPTTKVLVSSFDLWVPLLAETDSISAIKATCSSIKSVSTPTSWLVKSGVGISWLLSYVPLYSALYSALWGTLMEIRPFRPV